MSRNGDVVLEWGGEERLFRLAGFAELEKLQEACNMGPFTVLAHLSSGGPRVEHILETIRWGLIGGGASMAETTKLIGLYVKERPLAESLLTAKLILQAGLHGTEDEPPGKPEKGA